MRSAIHGSQQINGRWVYCAGFDQKVFIQDIPSNEEAAIYENPAYRQKDTTSGLPTQQTFSTTKNSEEEEEEEDSDHDSDDDSYYDVSAPLPTQQTCTQPTPGGTTQTVSKVIVEAGSLPNTFTQSSVSTQTQNSTSNSIVVEALSHADSRSNSRTTDLERSSSAASQVSRTTETKRSKSTNGPKKGDKIVTTSAFESSDVSRITIKPSNVMQVRQVNSGNLLVDCRDWDKMHWISKNNVKYLRRYRATPKHAPKRRSAATASKNRTQEFILNRDAVMRSGPQFNTPVITNLAAESTVLVNLKTYSKVKNITHKGQNKKRILVKAKNSYGDVNMGWITMSTEQGPMCRRKVRQQPKDHTPARRRRRRRFRN